MKKILLSFAFLGAVFTSNAQQIVFEDFETMNIGEIGTDITGANPGQGAWGTYTSVGANSDFQFVNFDADHGKSVKITGTATTGNGKYLFQDVSTDWGTRTTGNDIIEMEYDFYTGGATASKNQHGLVIFNNAGKVLAGFLFFPETKMIRAYANLTPGTGANGNYTIRLGGTLGSADILLNADSWYRLGLSYNSATGEIRFKEDNGLFDVAITDGMTYGGAALKLVVNGQPDEYDFVNFAGTGNASSSVAIFDNMNLKFTSSDELLSIGNDVVSSKFSIFPNPANDILNITNADNMLISGITVTDLHGRTIRNVSYDYMANVQVNVSDLASGLYILNVASDKGIATKKFVKN